MACKSKIIFFHDFFSFWTHACVRVQWIQTHQSVRWYVRTLIFIIKYPLSLQKHFPLNLLLFEENWLIFPPTHLFPTHPYYVKRKQIFNIIFFSVCVREGECVCDMLYVHVFHFYDKYHLLTSWTAPFHEGPNHCIIHDTFDSVYSIFTCLIPRDSIQHKYLPYHRKRYWKGQTCKIDRNFVWFILTKYWTNITKSTVLSETIG